MLAIADQPLHTDIDELLGALLCRADITSLRLSAVRDNMRVLSEEETRVATRYARRLVEIDEECRQILTFVQTCVVRVVPNMCALVGPTVASRLLMLVGGLGQLMRMAGSDLSVVGAAVNRRTLRQYHAGMSVAGLAGELHRGVVYEAPVVQGAPPDVRKRIGKIVANKLILCIRVDEEGKDHRDGSFGASLFHKVAGKIKLLMEPPPHRTIKAEKAAHLALKRKRRGGRAARERKARLGLDTEQHKLLGRMEFGKAEQTIGLDEEGVGMLGNGAAGLRVRTHTLRTSKAAKGQQHQQDQGSKFGRGGASAAAASKMPSSALLGGNAGAMSTIVSHSGGNELRVAKFQGAGSRSWSLTRKGGVAAAAVAPAHANASMK